MKVTGAGSGAAAGGGARRVGKADGRKSDFRQALVEAMDSAEDVHAAEAPSALGAVDALLVAQAVEDCTDREARQRHLRRADDILDMLEELRHGLLMGTVPEATLMRLAEMVRSRKEACSDPRLAALLDEIELRAEVELAKLGRGG